MVELFTPVPCQCGGDPAVDCYTCNGRGHLPSPTASEVSAFIREKIDDVCDEDGTERDPDLCELLRVLDRILLGSSLTKSFGAPGDWGHSHPIGRALSAGFERARKAVGP